jgi:NAD(P)H dehydrogenase (quinone)
MSDLNKRKAMQAYNNNRIFLLVLTCLFSILPVRGITAERSPVKVLILIHSLTGNTAEYANNIKEGLLKVSGIKVDIKQVPVLNETNKTKYYYSQAKLEDLNNYSLVIFGSPVYFSNVSAEMLSFFQNGLLFWKNGRFKGKKALSFFTTASGAGLSSARKSLEATLNSFKIDTDTLKNEIHFKTSMSKKEIVRHSQKLGKLLTIKGQKQKKIQWSSLPSAPNAVGLYLTYKIANNLIYINQIAIRNGKVINPGIINKTITELEGRQATRVATINILSVLKKALEENNLQLKQVVQLSGYFVMKEGAQNHSSILNESSRILIEILGEKKGSHTRAVFGVASLPLESSVELQAIFEVHKQ